MADKGKDGEDYEFLPPDFDEDQFIHKEMVSFKTTLILFLWGILAALASWLAFAQVGGTRTGWFLGLAICAVTFLALRPLFKRFNADLKHWGRREWLGTGLLFFFTWLGIFIVAINPPVSDFADPRIEVLVGPPVQQAGGMVAIDIFFEDNDRVAGFTFRLSQGGLAMSDESALTSLGRGHYQLSQSLPAGIYEISASATDDKGNSASANATFAVVDLGLKVSFLPANRTLDDTGQVFVKVEGESVPTCVAKKGRITNAPCIRTVHLDTSTGGRVFMEYSKSNNRWEASANFDGWDPGENVFNATAEVVGTWVGTTFVHGGTLASGPHTVTVTSAPGTYVPKVLNEPSETARSMPGLGTVVLVVGLVALAAFSRRR